MDLLLIDDCLAPALIQCLLFTIAETAVAQSAYNSYSGTGHVISTWRPPLDLE